MTGRGPRRWLALALALGLLRSASAGEGPGRAVRPPEENSSYVPDDAEGLRKAQRAADDAVAAKDWVEAVRALQRIVEGPADTVVARPEPGVFEGAAAASHQRVLGLGAPAVAAYEQEFGGRAASLVETGVSRRDPTALARAVDLYLPSAAGRRAALLLADVALEGGDVDAALGWLERLEDLEDVSAPDLAAETARWKSARLDRLAVALASSREAVPRIRAWLSSPGSPPPADADLETVPSGADWPTTDGDASRARVPDPLGVDLEFVADEALAEAGPDVEEEPASLKGRGARPSPWLPPRAVVAGGRVYVSDGRFLHVYDVATQKPVLMPVPLLSGASPADAPPERGLPARSRWGWIEGHGLTVSGDVVFASVSAVRSPEEGADAEGSRDETPAARRPSAGASVNREDHVVAIRLGERGGRILWEAGGQASTPGLPEGLHLFGTPLLYQGSLHVVGVRGTRATKDRFEAYHVALDPATGAARSTTFLGAGGPIRRQRDDEMIPASCAGARGRVVVLTSLGVAAAVDARTGRTVWSFRYDRGRPDGDDVGRRLEDGKEQGPRKSSFENQPPRLCDGRCFLAPTDARRLFALYDRPRGRDRLLRAWDVSRTEHFRNMAVEQVAGVTVARGGVPATLVAVGQAYVTEPIAETSTCVVGMDPATGVVRWERALPFGGEPEPFGTALVTATEVLVPTFDGIARYRLADGGDLPSLDRAGIPADRAALLDPAERPWGNLVPVPGRGLVAVNEASVAFWLRRPR